MSIGITRPVLKLAIVPDEKLGRFFSTTPSCFASHPFINEGEEVGVWKHCNFPFIDEGVTG